VVPGALLLLLLAARGARAHKRAHARQRHFQRLFQRLFVGVEIEARARVQAVAERAAQVARLREQESALSSRLQEVWGEVEAARRGALSRCVAGRSG
jgi:uncharacterized membrane protein